VASKRKSEREFKIDALNQKIKYSDVNAGIYI
jgi:hypothetical protein